jgi:two-component system, NarL family, response regulator NreC
VTDDAPSPDAGDAQAPRATRVLLAEDHVIVRDGLRLLFQSEPDFSVVAEAGNGRDAVARARETHPDLAILDISMPDMSGLEATPLIKAESPATQVLILTMHDSDEYFFRALEAGASGYVLKKAATQDLIAAARAVAHGEAYLYPSLAKKLIGDYVRRTHAGAEPSGHERLSDREREVLLLIGDGLSNSKIAERLMVSASTVQTHRAHILDKLELQTTADLIRYAIQHGLVG